MLPESDITEPQETAPGLPAVEPPSGRFIVQLFLVPGLIVTVAVLILLGFSWLVSGESAPEKLVDRLESPNADVRWRAANELAQRLKRDDQLAANPKLALRLTGMLRLAADDLGHKPGPGNDKERKQFLERRKDLEFLGPCVGNLILPTGVPVLAELAVKGKDADPKTDALLRRQAVWALANLGENVKRFANLPPEKAQAILGELQAASAGPGEQADWAGLAYRYLQGTQKNVGVIPALAECAKANDPFLRTLVANALTFWEGEGEEKTLAEKTLLTLSYDDGRGARIGVDEGD
jgi:hypothetical protein